MIKMEKRDKIEEKINEKIYLKMRESRENFRSCPQPWLLLMALASTIGGEEGMNFYEKLRDYLGIFSI